MNNDAAKLLNILSLLVLVADAADREDAEHTAEFFWMASPGARMFAPLSWDEQHMAPRF